MLAIYDQPQEQPNIDIMDADDDCVVVGYRESNVAPSEDCIITGYRSAMGARLANILDAIYTYTPSAPPMSPALERHDTVPDDLPPLRTRNVDSGEISLDAEDQPHDELNDLLHTIHVPMHLAELQAKESKHGTIHSCESQTAEIGSGKYWDVEITHMDPETYRCLRLVYGQMCPDIPLRASVSTPELKYPHVIKFTMLDNITSDIVGKIADEYLWCM